MGVIFQNCFNPVLMSTFQIIPSLSRATTKKAPPPCYFILHKHSLTKLCALPLSLASVLCCRGLWVRTSERMKGVCLPFFTKPPVNVNIWIRSCIFWVLSLASFLLISFVLDLYVFIITWQQELP